MLQRWPFLPFAVGLAAIYVGERTLEHTGRWVMLGVGATLVAAGYGLALWRLWRLWSSSAENRKAAAAAVRAYTLCLVALGLYALQATLLTGVEYAQWRTALMVTWPFVLLLGLAPALTMELALSSMVQSPALELWRVRFAGRGARIVIYAVIVFAGANYAAAQWNRKVDLSYFHTTQPSEPTLNLVKSLSEPVRLILFTPPGNEVMEQVRTYAESLAQASPLLKLEVVDQALVPELAREMKVRQNGVLAVAKGGRSETLQIGLDLETSRGILRKLDGEVQERLLKMARPPRTIYLTAGHLERETYAPPSDKRLGLADFKTLAESLGFRVKRLGMTEGLGSEIPKDAGIVVIAGPTEPFQPAEREAVHAFLERGGRLLALIDPDTGVTEDELLAPLGVRVEKNLLASDGAARVRMKGRGESPYDFATNRASSHASVTTLSQLMGHFAVVFLGAGAVERLKDAPPDLHITFTVHSLGETWQDDNGNRAFDAKSEKRGSRELVAAIERTLKPGTTPAQKPAEKHDKTGVAKAASGKTPADNGAPKKEGGKTSADKSAPEKPAADQAVASALPAPAPTGPMRAIVIGDADVAGDGILRNAGNMYLIADALKWLASDEQLAGKSTSEEDVPLVHKRADDAVWFYGVSFAVPAAVLGLGLVASRKSKKRRAS